MKNVIEKKVREIIKESLELDILPDQIDLYVDLDHYGVNSLTMIKIIVNIEKEFDIEFDDDDLDMENYKNVQSIILYLEKKVNN